MFADGPRRFTAMSRVDDDDPLLFQDTDLFARLRRLLRRLRKFDIHHDAVRLVLDGLQGEDGGLRVRGEYQFHPDDLLRTDAEENFLDSRLIQDLNPLLLCLGRRHGRKLENDLLGQLFHRVLRLIPRIDDDARVIGGDPMPDVDNLVQRRGVGGEEQQEDERDKPHAVADGIKCLHKVVYLSGLAHEFNFLSLGQPG